MQSPQQKLTKHITQSLRNIGIGQFAKSEVILSRGCDAVSEPTTIVPSTVFLRGALAQFSRTTNHSETLEKLADKTPPFGQ